LSRAREQVRSLVRERLADESGTLGLDRHAPICLAYPSPYRVGMSSLGFQTLYRILNDDDGPGCHRAFLPDAWEAMALPWPQPKQPILSYEAERPLSDYPIVALSVAYELEIVGVIRLLEGSGIPLFAADRGPRDPIVIAGGPLTTTNASALLPFVDLVIFGEGEELLPQAVETIRSAPSREAGLLSAAALPSTIVGEIERGRFESLPRCATVSRTHLPARSAITTPHTELADMFLVEPERGCSRACTFCVMRGPSTGGMRLLDIEVPLSLIPQSARRVGLVGAAVTDHPRLEELVERIVASGRGVGISSLRADRLTPQLVANLASGGYRQITVASDGISERLRKQLLRRIDEQALLNAAQLVRADPGVRGMKVYQMIGVPTESDADVEELVRFASELARLVPLTLGISTFVAKRNTPHDGEGFVGVKEAEARLRAIRKGLGGRVEVRPQSPRWAHIEWLLAQRGPDGGHAALAAVHAGARYRDFVDAFARIEPIERPLVRGDEALLERRARRARERLAVV
jgi:radical SAM superfamily enzyme YgiQ (UPF0313 family)